MAETTERGKQLPGPYLRRDLARIWDLLRERLGMTDYELLVSIINDVLYQAEQQLRLEFPKLRIDVKLTNIEVTLAEPKVE